MFDHIVRFSTMSTDKLFDFYLRSLARAVARGRTINAWIRHIAGAPEDVHERSRPNEFGELVNVYRLRAATRIIDEIILPAAKSMGVDVAEVAQKGNTNTSFEDAKALIENCVVLSMQLEQADKLESLAERVKNIEERRGFSSTDIWRISQN